MKWWRFWLGLWLGLACAPQATAAGSTRIPYGTLEFEPCTLSAPGQAATVAARCTRLRVPEDRAKPAGRKIELAVAWVPGNARHAAPDPVVMLAGGPGQSALDSFPMTMGSFRDVLKTRDVLLVDQRGTGKSAKLSCPHALDDPDHPVETIDPESAKSLAQACLGELGGADPRHYTTNDYLDDLEAVRTALGIAEWNLLGVSYGTRVGLEYLRRHPSRVRTLVLDSVVPPSLILGAEHARNLDASVNAQFARCDADAECRAKFGQPRHTLDRLLERLRAQPAHVAYRDPLTDEPREDELTAEAVASVVRLHAYVPQLFAMMPMLLSAADAGHYEGLMAQARMIEQLVGEQISAPLQLSVSCAEDAPWLRADPADRNTLLGTQFVDFLRGACSVWPAGRVPGDFHAPVSSPKPVLVLSGELDPVTPPRYGEEVVRTLPQGRRFVLAGQGHGVLGVGCTPRLVAQFVERADARRLDEKCLAQLGETPPFVGPYGWAP